MVLENSEGSGVQPQAGAKNKKARAALNSRGDRARASLNEVRAVPETTSLIDYSQPPEDLPVEIWPAYRKGKR